MKEYRLIWLLSFCAVSLCGLILFVYFLRTYPIKTETVPIMTTNFIPITKSVQKEIKQPIIAYNFMDFHDPIVRARVLIGSINTFNEKRMFGYSVTYVLRVLTAEGGNDREVVYGCMQCLYNAYIKLNKQFTPDKVCKEFQYTTPVDWYSQAAFNAFCDIFIHHNFYEPVKNSTVFYAPEYCWSEYHESNLCIFVCQIHGVKFFEQRY